jgi:phosphonate transport system substrate-binding protein
MRFPPIACAAGTVNASGIEALRAALVRMADHPDGRAVLGLLRLDGFSVEDPGLYDRIAAEVAVVRGGAG